MKKLQLIIALPSAILFLVSYLLNNYLCLFISLGGIFIATVIRIIRINKRGYVLGHPDAEKYDYHV